MRTLLLFLALLSGWQEAVAAPATFRIYHINDLHGFANPSQRPGSLEKRGGAQWLSGRLQHLRAEQPGVFLAAGDMIQGDTWTNYSQGHAVIDLLNHFQVDAMVVGNHEFDFGQDVLRRRVGEARFPVLGANVTGMPELKATASFSQPSGKITVIGLVTDDVPQSSHPRNTVGLKFLSPAQVAREQITAAQQTTDLFVLLTHIGHEQDMALANELCRGADAVTAPVLIVGGHSHTRVEAPVRVGNCAVTQAGDHGRLLGIVDVRVDEGKLLTVEGHLEEIDPRTAPSDPGIAALVKRYNDQMDTVLNQKAGVAAVDLIQEGARRQETNLGNWVADLVRRVSGAEAALINGGSIRTGIPAGEITIRQLSAMLPFDNYIVAVRMSGAQLLQALEHGVSGVESGEGRFPQVSGMTFVFDRRLPVGKRVTEVRVGGAPLELQREYTVATLDFLAAGGDGYAAFGEAIRGSGDFVEVGGAMRSSRLVYNDPGQFLRDVALDTLVREPQVAPVVEGRIVEVR